MTPTHPQLPSETVHGTQEQGQAVSSNNPLPPAAELCPKPCWGKRPAVTCPLQRRQPALPKLRPGDAAGDRHYERWQKRTGFPMVCVSLALSLV